MRQTISDAATRLFLDRGFDAVTIDDIAAAADVGRMTVFNHFPRKEDMFFDRDQEGRDALVEALRRPEPDVSPIETLRRFAHRVVAERQPYVRFFAGSQRFVHTVAASETLKARARAIRDELAGLVQTSLCAAARSPPDDPAAHLAATLLLATWSVALIEGHRTFGRTEDEESAKAAFLAVIDRGSAGLVAALTGTPYARPDR